jgi:outer membrane protein OmpA-like peptidoglycan-associated protein
MMMSRVSTLMAAACIAGVPAISMGADSTLVLVMGGEAYDGPPKFEVTFDGKLLGEGAVAAAIDTASVGRFAAAKDKTPYVQTFTFLIPAEDFNPDGMVGVTLTNEAYGGKGSTRDRNLYLASVAVNGRVVTASGLRTVMDGAPTANQTQGEFLVLPDGVRHGISPAPQGGWPGPEVSVADDRLLPSGVPEARLQQVSTDPVFTGSTGETEAFPEERIEVANLNQDPESTSPGCGLDEIYNVIGFNENSNELTPSLVERLDQVIADIGVRQCNVTVTGYSSKQGSIAANALFAIERAQNALKYLQERGVKFIRASATGVGATDQFGPDFRTNRRVVITVTP